MFSEALLLIILENNEDYCPGNTKILHNILLFLRKKQHGY
jgi:hypothetical protein